MEVILRYLPRTSSISPQRPRPQLRKRIEDTPPAPPASSPPLISYFCAPPSPTTAESQRTLASFLRKVDTQELVRTLTVLLALPASESEMQDERLRNAARFILRYLLVDSRGEGEFGDADLLEDIQILIACYGTEKGKAKERKRTDSTESFDLVRDVEGVMRPIMKFQENPEGWGFIIKGDGGWEEEGEEEEEWEDVMEGAYAYPGLRRYSGLRDPETSPFTRKAPPVGSVEDEFERSPFEAISRGALQLTAEDVDVDVDPDEECGGHWYFQSPSPAPATEPETSSASEDDEIPEMDEDDFPDIEEELLELKLLEDGDLDVEEALIDSLEEDDSPEMDDDWDGDEEEGGLLGEESNRPPGLKMCWDGCVAKPSVVFGWEMEEDEF